MAAIGRYRVLREHDGLLIGSYVIATPEQARENVELGNLEFRGGLNPHDEGDAAFIRRFHENPLGKARNPEPTVEEAVIAITGDELGEEEDEEESDDDSDDSDDDTTTDGYDELTVPELKDIAEDKGVDLTGKTLKQDIVDAIREKDAEEAD